MDNFILAFVVLLVFILISRMISEKATKKLEPDKKAALIDVFSKDRIWTLGALIVIFVFYFVSIKYTLLDFYWTNILYVIALLIYFLVVSVYSFKKLKEHNFPVFYIQAYLLSGALRLAGFGMILVLIEW